MESQDLVNFIFQVLLFWLAYKIGQIHGGVTTVRELRNQAQRTESIKLPRQRPIITVEEINCMFYAYDGSDFLAQASSPDDLGRKIAHRFPNKYHSAQIEIKA
jgi:hypothetical protein